MHVPKLGYKIKQNVKRAYYINVHVDKMIRKAAAKTGRSLSDIVNEAVAAYVKTL